MWRVGGGESIFNSLGSGHRVITYRRSSSLKFEPFADLFLLLALSTRINKMVKGGRVEIFM